LVISELRLHLEDFLSREAGSEIALRILIKLIERQSNDLMREVDAFAAPTVMKQLPLLLPYPDD
jgi:hypothetical protein